MGGYAERHPELRTPPILDSNSGAKVRLATTGDRKTMYALQGWFEIEASFNFDEQKWDFAMLTGGFTAGGGMGYEWSWNFQLGPIPFLLQLEAGAAGTVSFTSQFNPQGGEDYLTELRLYAYLQAFAGVGFDYAVLAMKLGFYGQIGLDASIMWLNRNGGGAIQGEQLNVTGEVGAKFQIEILFISYEKILWSQPIDVYKTESQTHKDIVKYWDELRSGASPSEDYFAPPELEEPETGKASAAPRASLLMADASGTGLYAADLEPTLIDRDYLEQYERTYDTSGPSLGGGFQLFSLFADGEASPVVKTLGNSYTQAAPSLTDDGGYLFYLDDLNDSGDATKVRAAVMTQNGTGYDSEHPVIFGEDDDSGYGDSGLNASGSGENVAAVWSRVMAEPAITEPGQTVTSDIQADMMNNSYVFVAVLGDGGWKVTDLTEDFAGGNLAPVVARKGDHILVAWRQVTSTTADVTDFNARDYIYCAVSNDGGKTWTKPTPIYNGTSGAVKGLETAMLPSGASAVVTYSDLILEGASAKLDSLTFTNLPGVSLEDFEADSDDPNTLRATIVADRVPSTGVLASAESATAQISLAGGPQNSGNALSGTVALTPGGRDTITITVIDGSETKTYILTVRNDGGASSGGGSSPSYAVETPEDVAHGTVTVRPSRAERGETVTITATPDEGYEVGSVTVTQADGTSVPVTQKGAGTYTFTMPRGKVEVEVTFVPEGEASLPFLDVAEGSWYYDAVSYVYEHGLMTGTSGTAFAPDANLTRAMMATVLWAMEGSPVVNYAMTYTDVSGGAWYAEAVRWATSEGVVSGVGDNRFDPDAPITREQMAVMLYAYARTQGYGVSGRADLSRYTDAAAIGSWAETALEWAVAEGLISGTSDTTLSPQGQATRAQVATILRNFHQSFGSD